MILWAKINVIKKKSAPQTDNSSYYKYTGLESKIKLSEKMIREMCQDKVSGLKGNSEIHTYSYVLFITEKLYALLAHARNTTKIYTLNLRNSVVT